MEKSLKLHSFKIFLLIKFFFKLVVDQEVKFQIELRFCLSTHNSEIFRKIRKFLKLRIQKIGDSCLETKRFWFDQNWVQWCSSQLGKLLSILQKKSQSRIEIVQNSLKLWQIWSELMTVSKSTIDNEDIFVNISLITQV